jgi:DNA polymerase-3 subunit epsilon
VASVVDALDDEPRALLDPLETRMRALAGEERFEEAAITRDRLGVLSRAFARERLIRAARAAGRVTVEDRHGTVEIDHGRLVGNARWSDAGARNASRWGPGSGLALDLATEAGGSDVAATPPRREEVDELLVVARYLFGPTREARLVQRADGLLASALPALPRYVPVGPAAGVRADR